jgi:hypothetical protein
MAHTEIPADVEAVVQRILSERARKTRRRIAAFGGATVIAVAAGLWGAPALAQVMCTQTLPSPLVTFCANSPARAADLNSNTQQLVNWLTQKVGTQGSPNVAVTGTMSVGGTSALQSTTVTGTMTVNGATTLQSTTATTLTVSGNELVQNALTVNGAGGNVAHACVSRGTTSPTSYQANCLSNEVAVGGGGRCTSTWRLTESVPWVGPNDADGPPSNGAVPRSWRSVCQVWGNAGTYAYPQLGNYVVCCAE